MHHDGVFEFDGVTLIISGGVCNHLVSGLCNLHETGSKPFVCKMFPQSPDVYEYRVAGSMCSYTFQ